MAAIKKIEAREILDSRGNPTVEASCEIGNGVLGEASVPSGASTGIHEAHELRDRDPARYGGLGVLRAVANVNGEIADALRGKECTQGALDEILIRLDGTADRSRLGANAILAVSLAFARASAKEANIHLYEYIGSLSGETEFRLPQPMFNVINGGRHADNGLDIQEYMILPIRFESVSEKIRAAVEIISALRQKLREDGHVTSVGDEGGFAPKLSSNEEALEYLLRAIASARYDTERIKMGMDAAASEFYRDGGYEIQREGEKKKLSSEELIGWYESLAQKYPIISIEDGLAEDDWDGFAAMTERFGDAVAIVGDDLTVTNTARIRMAANKKAINAVLVKPNQIGTLTETLAAIRLAKELGWNTIVSHRSGETDDTFIADLAVGASADFIKAGSLSREERVCKYNRLMQIEHILSSSRA